MNIEGSNIYGKDVKIGKTVSPSPDVSSKIVNCGKPNWRPPKTELTGLLMSFGGLISGATRKFKLETETKEYLLIMSEELTEIAERLQWEEVVVKGYLDSDSDVFVVEKINLSPCHDPFEVTVGLAEANFELERLKRTIDQRGKLEPAMYELAS